MLTSLEPLTRSYDIGRLIHLDVSRNKLQTIEEDLQAKLVNLSTMDVAFNQFAAFPILKGFLPKLRSLNILGNRFTIVPNDFFSGSYSRNLCSEWAVIARNAISLSKLRGNKFLVLGRLEEQDKNIFLVDSKLIRDLMSQTQDYSVNLADLGKESLKKLDDVNFAETLFSALRLRMPTVWQAMLVMKPQSLSNDHSMQIWHSAVAHQDDYFFDFCDRRFHRELTEACKLYDLMTYMICGK